MTLNEGIERLHMDDYLKIGCADGSGYIFAGKKSELNMNKLEEKYESKKKADDLLAKTIEALGRAKENLEPVYEKISKTAKGEEVPPYEMAVAKMKSTYCKRYITEAQNKVEAYMKWKPLRDREIKDTFIAASSVEDHTGGKPVRVFIVPGTASNNCGWVGDKGEKDE